MESVSITDTFALENLLAEYSGLANYDEVARRIGSQFRIQLDALKARNQVVIVNTSYKNERGILTETRLICLSCLWGDVIRGLDDRRLLN